VIFVYKRPFLGNVLGCDYFDPCILRLRLKAFCIVLVSRGMFSILLIVCF
jgi:hypothetical protein